MANDNKTRTIYNALKSIGSYKGSESEFNSYMYAPGAQGYNNRKSVYDTLVKEGADVGKSYEEFAQRMGLHAANKPKAAPKATPAPRPKASRPVTAVRPATQLRANEYTNVFVDRLRGENVTYKGEYKDAHPGVTDIVAAPKTNEQKYKEFVDNAETFEQREYEDTRRTLKALRQKGDKKGLEETRKAALSTNPGKSKFGDARAVLMDELYHPNGMLDVENNEQDKRFAETQLARTYEHETGEKLDFSKVQFTPEALKEFQEEYNSKDWVYDGKVKGEGGVSVSTFTPVDNADDIMYASKAEKKLDAAALNTSIDSLSNEISQYLGELEKSIDAKHNDLKWWQQFGRNTQQDYTANGRLTDPEWVSAVMAGDALKNSQQILRESDIYTRNGGKRSLSNNFVSGAFRGLVDKGFDIRTWDMGVSDALEASQLNTALQKADKGQQLTKGEQMLLDAKATELAVNYCVGDSVGRGYKAGSVTAESIPFMLEMAVNPSAAAGKSAQAMMVRYMLKRFSKKMVKNQAKKMFAAKLAARVGGDIVGAYGMTATTGAIRTGADAINRMSGELKPGQIDDDGHIRYAGHKEGDTR